MKNKTNKKGGNIEDTYVISPCCEAFDATELLRLTINRRISLWTRNLSSEFGSIWGKDDVENFFLALSGLSREVLELFFSSLSFECDLRDPDLNEFFELHFEMLKQCKQRFSIWAKSSSSTDKTSVDNGWKLSAQEPLYSYVFICRRKQGHIQSNSQCTMKTGQGTEYSINQQKENFERIISYKYIGEVISCFLRRTQRQFYGINNFSGKDFIPVQYVLKYFHRSHSTVSSIAVTYYYFAFWNSASRCKSKHTSGWARESSRFQKNSQQEQYLNDLNDSTSNSRPKDPTTRSSVG